MSKLSQVVLSLGLALGPAAAGADTPEDDYEGCHEPMEEQIEMPTEVADYLQMVRDQVASLVPVSYQGLAPLGEEDIDKIGSGLAKMHFLVVCPSATARCQRVLSEVEAFAVKYGDSLPEVRFTFTNLEGQTQNAKRVIDKVLRADELKKELKGQAFVLFFDGDGDHHYFTERTILSADFDLPDTLGNMILEELAYR